MKYSTKGVAPQGFVEWLALENEDWQPTYKTLQNPEKEVVHKALLREQGHLCAYCGRALKDDGRNSHIDHFWPQSAFGPGSADDRSLNYENFFASCYGTEGELADQRGTCGVAKADWFDVNDHILPSDRTCEPRFQYQVFGEILAADRADQAALNMIRHLRLDDAALTYERKVIISAIEEDIDKGEITAANVAAEIVSLRTIRDFRAVPFSQVSVRYLEGQQLQ